MDVFKEILNFSLVDFADVFLVFCKIENDENSTKDVLGKIFNNKYTCFTLSMGAPSGLNGYIVYKLDGKC